MPDDYIPSWNFGPPTNWECPTYSFNHVLGNPYAPDNQALMAGKNSQIRARYFWHAAEWLHSLPRMDALPLIVNHGADENNYSLPFYQNPGARPGRTYYGWPVRYSLRSPPAGYNGTFDAVLYRIGANRYARQLLPNMGTLGGGAAMDGILAVMVRMHLDESGLAWGGAALAQLRCRIANEVRKRFQDRLNGKRCVDFQVASGGRADPASPDACSTLSRASWSRRRTTLTTAGCCTSRCNWWTRRRSTRLPSFSRLRHCGF